MHAEGAPVLLVGTCRDQLKPNQLDEVNEVLKSRVRHHYSNVCMNNSQGLRGYVFFPLSNKHSTQPGLNDIKLAIDHAVRTDGEKYIERKVPIMWRQVYDAFRKTEKQVLNLDSAQKIAQEFLGEESLDANVKSILAFFHEIGILIHFKDSTELQKLVILEPQWLVDAISCIICDGRVRSDGKPLHTEARTKAAYAKMEREYDELMNTGRVSRRLLDVLWGDYQKEQVKPVFL